MMSFSRMKVKFFFFTERVWEFPHSQIFESFLPFFLKLLITQSRFDLFWEFLAPYMVVKRCSTVDILSHIHTIRGRVKSLSAYNPPQKNTTDNSFVFSVLGSHLGLRSKMKLKQNFRLSNTFGGFCSSAQQQRFDILLTCSYLGSISNQFTHTHSLITHAENLCFIITILQKLCTPDRHWYLWFRCQKLYRLSLWAEALHFPFTGH